MSADRSKDKPLSPVPRFQDKRQEIQTYASTIISVVGSGLGSGFTQVVNSPSEEKGNCQTGENIYQEADISEEAGEGLGIPFVSIHLRLMPQSQTPVHQQSLAT